MIPADADADADADTDTDTGTDADAERTAGAGPSGPAVRAARWTVLPSPIGPLLLAATGRGLIRVTFHADPRRVDRELALLAARLGARPAESARDPVLAHAGRELAEYFGGRRRGFSVPLDWSLTSGFNEKVLRKLAESVPYGAVVGYQDLADRVGEPGAARAVGAAMGGNPLPVVVACHRVVAADGGIGGFGGGLETKRALLALEGVLPAPLF
ncbi:methylated-DNA--[protein]-cysteine S-methyltransferase [Streptomyces aidingensis]|uniref:Methylated-DNA--protein-cysteine methyltransferase n=1 Tax=Streptomyces aidingensis TaxID=910347 RepID=A0A1I1MFT1_9ACTN|nr:methylated-DNA--[protein]-cysteine S-methyltransferase [Streptomyces aidingensis]SFC81938.1 methylated-DNA-[protein]-cysteine S-methyltransferase [Streptomyces aidingensis]